MTGKQSTQALGDQVLTVLPYPGGVLNVAGLSPTLFERYLSAAQKIARLAVGTPVPSPGARTVILAVLIPTPQWRTAKLR